MRKTTLLEFVCLEVMAHLAGLLSSLVVVHTKLVNPPSVRTVQARSQGGFDRTPLLDQPWHTTTVFIRIVAAATINFALSFVRLLIEGGSYSRAATITARQYRARARTRNNCVRTYVYERACPPYDIAL